MMHHEEAIVIAVSNGEISGEEIGARRLHGILRRIGWEGRESDLSAAMDSWPIPRHTHTRRVSCADVVRLVMDGVIKPRGETPQNLARAWSGLSGRALLSEATQVRDRHVRLAQAHEAVADVARAAIARAREELHDVPQFELATPMENLEKKQIKQKEADSRA